MDGSRARRPLRGDDLVRNYNVTLKDLYNGKSVNLSLQRMLSVRDATEKAADHPLSKRAALVMAGVSKRASDVWVLVLYGSRRPPAQHAVGRAPRYARMTSARGAEVPRSSTKRRRRRFIEKGMRHGEKITLMGEADQQPGVEPGDFILVLQQKPHSVFERSGDDLMCKVRITLADALCEFLKIVLIHLDGRSIHLEHPAGDVIHPGHVKRIAPEALLPRRGTDPVEPAIVEHCSLQDASIERYGGPSRSVNAYDSGEDSEDPEHDLHGVQWHSLKDPGWEALNDRQTGLLMEQRREIEIVEAEHCELSEKISQSKSKAPTASRLEYKEMKTYGGMPMSDEVVVVTCVNCEKPMIPSAYKEHRTKCKASQTEPPAEAPLSIRTDAVEKKADTPKSKKRKESAVFEEPETPSSAMEMSPPPSLPEKKPYEKKPKVAKPPKVKPPGRVKGPLDLDKQCGVIIPGGAPCARSLTCKSHSMSSKRAVEGRSRPYDVLLGMYQKKPVAVKDEKAKDSDIPLAEKEDVNVDSDEEFNDLLDSVKSYEPQPLAVRPTTYIRRRNNCLRIRDLFFDALKGPCRPILPSGTAHEQSSMHL
ncbi:hypothetical protein BGX28_001425 [Mortierella sp. GBA30]|nr:hypothetical protein BGX28_001425 [Mortierella sp. GBA30]